MSARTAPRFGRVGRYLLPHGDRAVASYFVERLLVGHGRREDMAGRLVARLGGRGGSSRLLLGRPRPPASDVEVRALDALEALVEGAPGVLRAAGIGPDALRRSIVLLDHPRSGRRRLVVFPFRPGEERPAAVLKLRPRGAEGLSLQREWEALRVAGQALPRELGATLPRPLALEFAGDLEVLAASHLEGTSAYVQMQARRRPGRAAERHFQTAAGWLAAFHRATRSDGPGFTPGDEAAALARLSGRTAEPQWLRSLQRSITADPIPLCAGHGDFWARNLLLGENGGAPAGVVDWEHFAPEAPPHQDLLHFPLTYGLNFPWSRQRRREPVPQAFRLVFLEENPVSRAVHRYLFRYCADAQLEPALLRPLLHLELLRRARDAGPQDRADWLACERLLADSPLPLRDDASADPAQ